MARFCIFFPFGADFQYRVGQLVTTPRRRFLRKFMASLLVRHGAKIATLGNVVGLVVQRPERD
jgi:hypothetical protein